MASEGGVLFSADAADRIAEAVRQVEGGETGRGARPARRGPTNAGMQELFEARTTSGTPDGGGNYPATLTVWDNVSASYTDYAAIKIKPPNGETLQDATRYTVRPAGSSSDSTPVYMLIPGVGTITTVANRAVTGIVDTTSVVWYGYKYFMTGIGVGDPDSGYAPALGRNVGKVLPVPGPPAPAPAPQLGPGTAIDPAYDVWPYYTVHLSAEVYDPSAVVSIFDSTYVGRHAHLYLTVEYDAANTQWWATCNVTGWPGGGASGFPGSTARYACDGQIGLTATTGGLTFTGGLYTGGTLAVSVGSLAPIAANSLVANATGSSAAPSAAGVTGGLAFSGGNLTLTSVDGGTY